MESVAKKGAIVDFKMLSMIVQVDNVGAISMMANVSTSSQTKNVETKYHFVRENVGDGFIKIIFG
jgi:hypothetical protein